MTSGTIRLDSPALGRAATYSLLLPDPQRVGPGPYPVLLQLHGRGDDHTAWVHKSNLARYVESLPLIVVLPDGGNFWWSNLGPDLRYEDFLLEDLWAHVQSTFPARPDGRWAIGGLSMGGFGAIHLALKHPARFCSVFAHSSALPTPATLAEWLAGYPETVRADLDCYGLAARIDPAALPQFSFDCGLDDHLLPQNQRFHTHLQSLGLPHLYAEHPGAHTWAYWDRHVQTALRQHAQALGIAAGA